jgi:phosphohistidine swiveling domain-containing protein
VVTTVPCVKVMVLLLAVIPADGVLTVKLLPLLVTLETPVPLIVGVGEAGTVAVVTTVPCVNVIVLLFAVIPADGVLTVKLLPELVTLETPVPLIVGVIAEVALTV